MFLFVLYALITLAAVVTALILYARWNYGYLEKLGIPVETPTFMWGSLPDVYNKNPMMEDIQRFKKHGSVFGVYEGRHPNIYVADPELVKLILVKDYDHFHSRTKINFGHPVSNEILDYLPDEKWKTVRSMLTPALTSSRLKHVSRVTNTIMKEFIEDLLQECVGERLKIDFRNRLVPVMTDIVANGMYDMEIDNRKDPNNSFVQLLKTVLCEHTIYDFRYVLMQVFPFLKNLFPSWPFPTEGLDRFRILMLDYLKKRRSDIRNQNYQRKNNLGDVFLDMMNRLDTPEFKKLGINPDTAIDTAAEVFFGVYDSTGSSITMCLYYLSQNPEIQERVIEEVDSVWENDTDEFPLEALGDLVYLTACLNEALRLAPPFLRPERKCTKDWTATDAYGYIIRIPEGANVLVPLWALQRHPDYFPDPETFNPDRFLPENIKSIHPYAFVPFGHGPKNCIGMKYAYTNMKIILAYILKNFRVEPIEESKLKFKHGRNFVVQFHPLYFNFLRRH